MYAELVCRSNYSFLTGASHPEELVCRAAELGLSALAVCDDDGVYGLVKAHLEAKARGLKLLVSSSLTLLGAPKLVLYAANATGYSNLSRLISESRLSHPKGEAGLDWRRVAERSEGLLALLPGPPTSPTPRSSRWPRPSPGASGSGCRATSPPTTRPGKRAPAPAPTRSRCRWWRTTTCTPTTASGRRCKTC
jgi:error-prone DNA polymerase